MEKNLNNIPIDEEKVSERIADIKEALQKLAEYKLTEAKDLTRGSKDFVVVSYWIRVALEAVLTIGTHVLSRLPTNGYDKDYTQVLLSLGDYGVIPKDFSQKIKGMASYRNRLVHGYWKITPDELIKILHEDLADFDEFISHLNQFLKKR
jgi:uncharacterized protein YutE (UPF0331/DUF86 family)